MSLKIRECAIPKYKKDWPGRTLLMKEACPTTRMSPYEYGERLPSLIEAGVLVKLERFLSKSEATLSGHSDLYQWAEKEGQRVIKIGWRCPRCASPNRSSARKRPFSLKSPEPKERKHERHQPVGY